MTMAKLTFGTLSDAWKGEATDFTPLLADQLDNLGDALGIDLAAVGKYQNGYIRVYNSHAQPVDVFGKPGPGSATHISQDYMGQWPGWPQ